MQADYLHAEHCDKVCANLPVNAIVYVPGAAISVRPGTDVDLPFRQDSNFLYQIIDITSVSCSYVQLLDRHGYAA